MEHKNPSEIMKIKVSIPHTRICGKISQYHLNAYNDAKLAEDLITYIKTKGLSKVKDDRVLELINTRAHFNLSYLVGLAYTEYGINGMIDFSYAHLISNLLHTLPFKKHQILKEIEQACETYAKKLKVKILYHDFYAKKQLIFPWIMDYYFKKHKFLKEFLRKRFGETIKIENLDMKEIINAAIVVQEINIKSNSNYSKILKNEEPSTNPKVVAIRKLATKFYYEKAFIRGAANTLLAASRWDKLFILTLKRIRS
jgi:hypothetical protein